MSSKKRDIPVFNHPIIETHCHLDYLKENALADILTQCAKANVERVITIGVSPDNLASVLQLTEAAHNIYGTLGVHPHDAEKFTAETATFIREQATAAKIVAIGEIGLDYYYEHSDRKTQQTVFETQLQIACDLNLPVVIHSREADEDTRAILQNFSGSLKRKGVIHSFTSGIELAQFAINDGFCLGFNGICTFPKADNVREIIRITPAENILLETDSPYLTPVPFRGRENAPFYIPFVAEHVAQVKEMDIETLLPVVYQNSLRVFFPDATAP
ncbi:MAG: TatD family hydrolase [Oceanospirillaceae bacterium]|nr:TatD family hydrolase [Oceanospirillaceae bacterium]MCP5335895.1 TatD family hydrolase [Oceanospirillaceae bacterium]